MTAHLDRIVAGVREDLEARKAATPFPEIEAAARANARRRDVRGAFAGGPGIIAEIKRRSPSKGWIRRELDAAEAARAYVRGGARAVSVLTEGRFFGGSLRDLSEASAACGRTPALRKDFILDEYMLAESRAFGADLVLLMVSVLGDATGKMVRSARARGLEPLVEVRDAREMEIAARSGAWMIGINNRDLSTLEVDLRTSERLLPLAPAGALKVVESGISSPEEIARLHALGAEAFLVGEALVASDDPAAAIRTLTGNKNDGDPEKERNRWKRSTS